MKNIRITGKLLRNIAFLVVLFFAIIITSYLSIYKSDFDLGGGLVVPRFYINLCSNLIYSVLVVVFAWVLVSFLYRFSRVFIVAIGFSLLFMVGIFLFSMDSLKQEEAIANQNVALNQNGEIVDEQSPLSYPKIYNNALRLIIPINASLSLLMPSAQYDLHPYDVHNGIFFHLYYLAIYFLFAFLFLSLLGRRLLNIISAMLVPFKSSNIFWGYSKGAMALGEEIAKSPNKDESIFVLFDDVNKDPIKINTIFENINRNKALALFANSEKSFSKRLYKAYRHFFMTQDQDFNIRMALALGNAMKKPLKTPDKDISIYIFAEKESVYSLFESFSDSNIDIHIYNYADLTARSFVKEYPILMHKEALKSEKIKIDKTISRVEGEFNILLLGLGSTGFEILNKSLCDAQFGQGFNLNVTCIDRDYDLQHSKYKAIFDDSEDYGYSLEVNPTYLSKCVSNPNSQLFFDWLSEDCKILNFDRIIICLGEDELNIKTALEVVKYRMRFQTKKNQFENVFVHLRDFAKYEYYNSTETNMITMFGGEEVVNSYDLIVDEKMDKVARLVNFVYSKSEDLSEDDFDEKDIESQWNKCSLFYKDSSRAVGMNINNMFILTGGEESFKDNVMNTEILEYFAELEHMRWCAFLYMNYVRKWDFKDVNTSNGKQIFNDVHLKHIAQIPYCDLGFNSKNPLDFFDKAKASGVVNNIKRQEDPNIKLSDLVNYQESARRIVRHFPSIVSESKKINQKNNERL